MQTMKRTYLRKTPILRLQIFFNSHIRFYWRRLCVASRLQL